MTLTAEQHERLTDMLQGLRAELPNMSSWAQGFVKDMCERHDKYGLDTYVSPKQWAKLKELYDEWVGDADPDDPLDLNDEIPF